MKLNFRFWSLIVFFASYFSYAVASPTSNEYGACHQQASHVLLTCLEKRPGHANDACWDASKRSNDACYAKVNQSHRPDSAKIEAMKKAMKKNP